LNNDIILGAGGSNVAIGTTTANVPLTVRKTAYSIYASFGFTGGNPSIVLGASGSVTVGGSSRYLSYIDTYTDNSDNTTLAINWNGYSNETGSGSEWFRDTIIGNGKRGSVLYVDGSASTVGIGNTISIGPRLDVRSNASYTSAMTQPAFFGSNDTTGPLGVVIQTISGSGNAIRTEITSTRYGVSGNDLTLNRDSGAGAGGLTVKYQGHVGINNPNPVYHLDVEGTSRTTSTAMIGSGVGLLQFSMDWY